MGTTSLVDLWLALLRDSVELSAVAVAVVLPSSDRSTSDASKPLHETKEKYLKFDGRSNLDYFGE